MNEALLNILRLERRIEKEKKRFMRREESLPSFTT
jgi:hypothetical protein